MVRWDHFTVDAEEAAKATRVFRPDVYRSALKSTGDDLPAANSKVEGSVSQRTQVGTQQGAITLSANSFFDGRSFDPDRMEAYLTECE
jgi:NitT/TauT family transport system ATP-binding protein